MTKNDRQILTKKYTKQAKKTDWCDLAGVIMTLEECVRIEKKAKHLKILNLKLEIFEKEKSLRVFDSFDMEYFMSRDYEDFDADYS